MRIRPRVARMCTASAPLAIMPASERTMSMTDGVNAGEKRTWTAADKLLLWSGNAGNVSVIFNGKSLGRLGAPGEVVKVTWVATG